jgi:hypothetical protein
MSTENNSLFDMALMAEASYVNFDALNGNFLDIKAILQSATDGGNFTAEQADYFVKHWQVVAHQKNTTNAGWDNGFSATLFKSRTEENHYVYAIRGTEVFVGIDGADDIVTDVSDLVADGVAIDQVINKKGSGRIFFNQHQ